MSDSGRLVMSFGVRLPGVERRRHSESGRVCRDVDAVRDGDGALSVTGVPVG